MQGKNAPLGALLREWRTAGGLSLSQLAQKAGVDKSALSRWERGSHIPCVPELEATLNALNVSSPQRVQAFSRLDAPRGLRRLRRQTDIPGLGPPPAIGDLLRALRGRKGWTQTQVASRMGVGQSAIARWERSERLPSTEDIQTLCYLLEAQEEEMVALTTGQFSEITPVEMNASPHEAEASLSRALTEFFRAFTAGRNKALAELTIITLERQAWLLATQRESARSLLAEALAYHAEIHHNQSHWEAVFPLTERALALTSRREREPPYALRASILWASATVYGGKRPLPHLGLRYLNDLIDRSCAPAYTAWMLGDMAKFTALEGRLPDAIALAERACRIAATDENADVEVYLRSMQYAKVLLQAGRVEAALRVAPEPTLYESEQYARNLLFFCEAHLVSGNKHEAQEWLQRSCTIIETHNLSNMRLQSAALSKRF